MSAKWRSLCSRSNLNLAYTLRNGQSFCWRLNRESEFSSVLDGKVISLREHGDSVEYFVHKPISDEPMNTLSANDTAVLTLPADGKKRPREVTGNEQVLPIANVKRKKEKRIEVTEGEGEEDEVDDSTLQILRSYFQLGGLSASDRSTNVNPTEEDILSRLYKEWAKADDRMRIIVEALPGMRILRQPPVECLFSFICSSNNNISRITQMLEKLRQRYGTKINVNDAPSSTISSPTSSSLSESSQTISTFYSFPTVEALSAASEEELRGLGLGYRAKFVRATAIALSSKGGEDFLISLRSKPRKEVQAALLEFVGVGMKVADCVALFSLDQSDCIPVDTHVWNIACCYFDRTLVNHKSLTPTVYEKVGDIFRTRYGASHAGWAHSLLFAAELPSFRSKLPSGMQSEMTQFKDDEKARKADATAEKKKRKKLQEVGKEVDEQEVVEKEELSKV